MSTQAAPSKGGPENATQAAQEARHSQGHETLDAFDRSILVAQHLLSPRRSQHGFRSIHETRIFSVNNISYHGIVYISYTNLNWYTRRQGFIRIPARFVSPAAIEFLGFIRSVAATMWEAWERKRTDDDQVRAISLDPDKTEKIGDVFFNFLIELVAAKSDCLASTRQEWATGLGNYGVSPDVFRTFDIGWHPRGGARSVGQWVLGIIRQRVAALKRIRGLSLARAREAKREITAPRQCQRASRGSRRMEKERQAQVESDKRVASARDELKAALREAKPGKELQTNGESSQRAVLAMDELSAALKESMVKELQAKGESSKGVESTVDEIVKDTALREIDKMEGEALEHSSRRVAIATAELKAALKEARGKGLQATGEPGKRVGRAMVELRAALREANGMRLRVREEPGKRVGKAMDQLMAALREVDQKEKQTKGDVSKVGGRPIDEPAMDELVAALDEVNEKERQRRREPNEVATEMENKAALSDAGKEEKEATEEAKEIARAMEEIKAALRREVEKNKEQAKGESSEGVRSVMDELD